MVDAHSGGIIRITVFINGDSGHGVERGSQTWSQSGPFQDPRPQIRPPTPDRHPEMDDFWTPFRRVLPPRHDVYTCVHARCIYMGCTPYVYIRVAYMWCISWHLDDKVKSPDFGISRNVPNPVKSKKYQENPRDFEVLFLGENRINRLDLVIPRSMRWEWTHFTRLGYHGIYRITWSCTICPPRT